MGPDRARTVEVHFLTPVPGETRKCAGGMEANDGGHDGVRPTCREKFVDRVGLVILLSEAGTRSLRRVTIIQNMRCLKNRTA